MKSKSAEKVKLNSFDDLFGINETGETVTSVPLSELHTFKGHPFRVLDDEKMQETVESVKQYGVLMPGIVRPYPEGGYEVIAGHRRWRACELAGLTEMPVIIREMDDDTAVVLMVDTNIQREDILPSEKAKAYRMKYEAMKHQGSKGEKYTADAIGEAAGDSGRTVQRYIRLSELAEELLDYVDENKIPMVAGEKLSYLKAGEQAWVVDAIGNSGIFPSKVQAELLKAGSEAGELTEGKVYAVLVRKEEENVNVTISAKKIRNYFPVEYSKEQIEDVIYTLLEEWKQKEGGTTDAGVTV
jgi:ParB family chromosome partitioning protein